MFEWLVVVVLGCYLGWWLSWLVSPRDGAPPGPPGLPLLGHLLYLDPARPYLSLAELARSYGPVYYLRLGRLDTVVLSEPRLVRAALASEDFAGRADLFLTHGIMDGYGLIAAEGERWKEQRKFVLSWLKNVGMVKLGPRRARMQARILAGLRETIKMVEEKEGEPVEIGGVLLHCMGNVMNDLLFGRTWQVDDPTWQWLRHLSDEGVRLIGVAGPLNFFPFLRWLPHYRKMLNKILDGKRKTHKLYKEFVSEIKDGDSLAAAFLSHMGKNSFTEEQLYHLLADLWGAGVDTTFTTLRWFLLFLAVHPHIQRRLQEELDAKLKAGQEPSLEDVPFLPYLEATIAETQRIRPVTPLGIPHACSKETDLGGYVIPRNTMVIPLQWAVHMDPRAWPEPNQFRPERFLDEQGQFIKHQHFIPFQTGKRACVGEELARMMLSLFGAGLVRRYRLELAPQDGGLDMTGVCGLTLNPPDHCLIFTSRI